MEKKLQVAVSDINYGILTKLAMQHNLSVDEMAHKVFHYGILWATGEKQRRITTPKRKKAHAE